MAEKKPIAVIALGGNAISDPNSEETIYSQFAQTRKSLNGIIEVLRAGFEVVISHGNGPQVGYELQRVEAARGVAPDQPLGLLVAATEGWMGYMIVQSLINRLQDEKIKKPVVSLISQVLVDPDDPSLQDPTKYVGSTMTEEEAKKQAEEFGWTVKEDAGRNGWRRVVGSPIPLKVVNAMAIKFMLENGFVVISAGGGGIPAYRDEKGHLEGLDAVIDKDRASAVLGNQIKAKDLIIATAVEKVSLNFGKDNQIDLDTVTLSEAKEYGKQGHFAAGSMGPKVEAAISFIEGGGNRVIITDLDHILSALKGEAGTIIVRD